MDPKYKMVQYGDILAAARGILGKNVTLQSYHCERATTSVQGFTSLMLRVRAKLDLHGEEIEARFIVKGPPLLEAQQNILALFDVHAREVIYFTKIVPVLKGPTPLVTCHLGHGATMVMEDLCQAGYKTLFKDMIHFASTDIPLSVARLVARKLAQLHAASINCKFDEVVETYLQKDQLTFDLFKNICRNGSDAAIMVLKHLYPETSKHLKYTDWLSGDNLFEIMNIIVKPVTDGLNVICHGDCWMNNMMFKYDPVTNEPIDLKFIDLQIFRKTHPSRDLLYFLYTSFSLAFRQKYEQEIIKTYVEAFNAIVCLTPDLLTIEDFTMEYEKARMFGQAWALIMRPMLVMENVFPQGDEELSSDHVDALFTGGKSDDVLLQFEKNERYRKQMIEVIHETMRNLESANLV